MKKIYLIAFTVLATLALSSCVQEIQDDNTSNVALGENDIAFVMKGGAATRAGENVAAVSRGVTIPLGVTEDGTSLYLEETVTNLDAVAPVTRGTPAYTENLGVLYANQLGVHAEGGSFGDLAFNSDSQATGSDGSWRYYHYYDSSPWPAENAEKQTVDFYLRMPATINGLTANGTTIAPAYDDETITITYTSPATAADMQDILFGFISLDQATYKANLPKGGTHVTLYHALTGVKFAIGNDDNDIENNSIAIKEISFVGLKDKGTCTITPTGEGITSATAAVWSNLGVTAANAVYSSGEYKNTPVTYTDEGDFGDAGSYPDSFTAGGNEKNLGKADASQTFWLIPQEMTDDIRLKITYTFAGNESTGYLDFGKVLKKSEVVWKPGELRTYTIRVEDVNLQIEDDVTKSSTNSGTTDEPNFIVGSYKDNVVIKNTGNTEVFIRAAIVGQWLDNDGNPVFGFTDDINDLYLVESWYEDQFVNHKGTHGVFDDLPGYRNDNEGWLRDYGNELNNWVYNPNDQYYYYTLPVAPGDVTGHKDTDGTTIIPDPLFTSYTIKKVPVARNAGEDILEADMHFTLEIATQAISARKSNGTVRTDYAQAWIEAKETGETVASGSGE